MKENKGFVWDIIRSERVMVPLNQSHQISIIVIYVLLKFSATFSSLTSCKELSQIQQESTRWKKQVHIQKTYIHIFPSYFFQENIVKKV